ncbi:MAG: pyridoxal phosphate-dependent aminotransferase [Pseudomonadota bacterium]
MRVSQRLDTINGPGGSDGWEILLQARALAKAGTPVIDLTIGDHDRTTPAPLIDAMAASARGGHTGYAPIPGTDALRAAIAHRAARRTGVPTAPENVLVTAGGQAALFAALMAATDPGDRVGFLDPHYATYPGTIRAVSAVPHAVSLRAETGFIPGSADFADLPPVSAFLINTPNNPTGAVYGADAIAAVATAAPDAWLISDEVYDTQVWEGPALSARAVPGLADRTLVIGSLSKSHVMTGWRLGWIVGPAGAIAAAADLLVNTTYGVPGFIQDAGLHALTGAHHGIEADVTRLYADRRKAALEALEGAGLRISPPQGGMYVMLDIRGTGRSGIDFAQDLLDTHGIAVMPGESFGAAAAGHLRIALTRPRAELTAALRTLTDFAGARRSG